MSPRLPQQGGPEQAFRRRAVLVLGMHRSGTSAVTRVVSLLGAGLPSDLMGPIANDNDTGFWESTALHHAHETMLAAAGSSWDDVAPLDPAWLRSSIADEFVERVVRTVEDKFGNAPIIVVKDPRICRFVPFWQRVLDRLAIQPAFVIPIRNPLEVAGSLQARNGFPPSKSLLLWLRHLLDAERDTRGQPRSFVSYEMLLGDWRAVVDKLEADLGLSWPRGPELASIEVSAFLSPGLRHHQVDAQHLKECPEVVAWVVEAYEAALATVMGNGDDLSQTFDALRAQLDTAQHAFGPILIDLRTQLNGSAQIMRDRDATIEHLSTTLDGMRQDVLNQGKQLAENAEHIADLQRELDAVRQSALLATQARDLALRDAELARQEQALVMKDTDLVRQERAQALRDAQLARQEQNAAQYAAEQDRLAREIARQSEEQARQDVERIGNALGTARREAKARLEEIARLKAILAELYSSRSYRLTAPLRALSRFLRRLI